MVILGVSHRINQVEVFQCFLVLLLGLVILFSDNEIGVSVTPLYSIIQICQMGGFGYYL